MISTLDIAWFAGLYEGEGTVGSEKSKLLPRIHVEMTDEDVIERAVRITGGHMYRSKPPKRGNKAVYRLVVNGDNGVGWLMTIYPLLGSRRQQQVSAALERWKHRTRQQGGWAAHRAKHGCLCQHNTGSCQRKLHPVERLSP